MSEPAHNYTTNQANPPFPPSEKVDVGTLARLFRDTTASYKYIFFLSLLELLKSRRFDANQPIPLNEILIEMLVTCWYPHTYFKLSFGSQDKLAAGLDAMQLASNDSAATNSSAKNGGKNNPITSAQNNAARNSPMNLARGGKEQVRQLIVAADSKLPTDLLRYVPFRLVRPFFALETRGLKDYQVNEAVADCAQSLFAERKPLFRIDEAAQAIVLHPDWAKYLWTNYVFVKGWISWEWADYMQRHNPNVPSVAQKLYPPDRRQSLAEQTTYWRNVLSDSPVRCIYTGEIIEANNFSLDHYLPWSFVVHDQLWNLIPTLPSVNSAKSDNLPAAEYLEKFVDLQYTGLDASHRLAGKSKWEKQVEPFVAGLRLSYTDLLDRTKLTGAFNGTVKPLIDLAASQGFAPGWHA